MIPSTWSCDPNRGQSQIFDFRIFDFLFSVIFDFVIFDCVIIGSKFEVFGHFLEFESLDFLDFEYYDRQAWYLTGESDKVGEIN